jgi:hypothetical protein
VELGQVKGIYLSAAQIGTGMETGLKTTKVTQQQQASENLFCLQRVGPSICFALTKIIFYLGTTECILKRYKNDE